MIDLVTMTTPELRALQDEVVKAIKERDQAEFLKAREEILAIAKRAGYSVGELVAGIKVGPGKVKAVVPIQYRDESDGSKTWTGRGRPPKWVKESLAGGKTLDDLRV